MCSLSLARTLTASTMVSTENLHSTSYKSQTTNVYRLLVCSSVIWSEFVLNNKNKQLILKTLNRSIFWFYLLWTHESRKEVEDWCSFTSSGLDMSLSLSRFGTSDWSSRYEPFGGGSLVENCNENWLIFDQKKKKRRKEEIQGFLDCLLTSAQCFRQQE